MKPRSTALATPAGRAGPLAGTLRARVAAVLVSAAIGLAGCTPDPAPQPTPTPLFASEAEAFTAAEQVYRDYIAAENTRQAGDKSADPEQFLTGEALSHDIESKRDSQAKGTRVDGAAEVVRFEGKKFESDRAAVTAAVCLDVSRTRVVDAGGEDITPASRPKVASLEVSFVAERHDLKVVRMTPGTETCV